MDVPVFMMGVKPYKDTVILTGTEIELIEQMDVRPDDIWVVSFPKSGTTLVQEIAYLIATNLDFKTASEKQMDERFPFLDLKEPSFPYYRGVKHIEEQPSPRFIKSHLQHHLLPKAIHTVKPKIMYVARHPKDVFVSFYYFIKFLGELPPGMPLDLFCMACANDIPFGSPWWKHVLDFWLCRHDDNILFLKYEDIIKDLPATVRQIGKFMEKDLSEDAVAKIADHCSFKNMKNNNMVNLTYMSKVRKIDMEDGHLLRKARSSSVGKCGCDWRNGAYGLCEQRSSRSACASAQSDQDLHSSPFSCLNTCLDCNKKFIFVSSCRSMLEDPELDWPEKP